MQKTPIYIDINTRSQITESGALIDRTILYPAIERGQWAVLCFTFLNRQDTELGVTLEPADLSGYGSFLLVADDNFLDNDSLMLKSLQNLTPFDESDPVSNMCNISGDWVDGTTAEPELGQISFRINSDTVKFASVMGNVEIKLSGLYMAIKSFATGFSNPSTIAWIKFKAANTVRDWSSAQVVPPEGVEYISYINSYLLNPFEYQYTANGTDWHTTLAPATDVSYRVRIANISADWSTAQPLLFGSVNTLSIGTVDSGEVASASITGTAPNQLLNLTLQQGPAGAPGGSFSILQVAVLPGSVDSSTLYLIG